MKNSTEHQFASLIKLRHLSNAVQSNWDMLKKTEEAVTTLLDDARLIMAETGTPSGKTAFEGDYGKILEIISKAQKQLDDFGTFIQSGPITGQDTQVAWGTFNDAVDSATKTFAQVGIYPQEYFINNESAITWEEVWKVIQSNIYVVQGLGEAAFIKVKMMENFQKEDVELLLNEIAKHIPVSFNLLKANKYRAEYLQAVKEIEEESNKKDNLWDRFLNVLANNIPFKQTPEERVMMRRWLDGERGEL